jgi:hypothetical protein
LDLNFSHCCNRGKKYFIVRTQKARRSAGNGCDCAVFRVEEPFQAICGREPGLTARPWRSTRATDEASPVARSRAAAATLLALAVRVGC